MQYSILREHQKEIYGKRIAFLLSVITRWGTQAGLISSVMANKEALRAYSFNPRADLDAEVITTIQNPQFWSQLDEMKPLIYGIHERQIQSESDNAHIGNVWNRWLEIESHTRKQLQQFKATTPPVDTKGNAVDLLKMIAKRRKIQLEPIHLIAYFLDPTNLKVPYPGTDEINDILFFFDKYGDVDGKAKIQFAEYRTMQNHFSSLSRLWEFSKSPAIYWAQIYASGFAPELSELAMRVFQTPANSVPSERSFSTQNLVHDRKRNSLDPGRVNKLVFIHVNKRVLDRHSEGNHVRNWIALEEQDRIDLEEGIMVQQIEDSDIDFQTTCN